MLTKDYHSLKFQSALQATASLPHTSRNAFAIETIPWNFDVHFEEVFEFKISNCFHFHIKYRAHSSTSLNDLEA